ncbi:MAG TPA: hypothetical protein VGX28_11715 [Frankiaceae bacterium]|jgi:hypothetical protein|nr:hypothetical protein [Frankiaceae bacterium]
MRKPLLLLAAALVAATPVTAGALYRIEPLVQLGTGGCRSNYTSAANVDDTHVCVRTVTLDPDLYVSNTGCAAGYIEVGSSVAHQWVCATI